MPIPDLSEERRNEIKKMTKTMGEQCKISIRNIRREANEELKKLLKAKEIAEDEEKKEEKNIQNITDDSIKKIDDKERYDEAAQMKTLIVMQILGNTKTFFETQSTIVDTDVNEYLNKTIEDQYGILFDMAQGQTMEDIINAQY